MRSRPFYDSRSSRSSDSTGNSASASFLALALFSLAFASVLGLTLTPRGLWHHSAAASIATSPDASFSPGPPGR